MIKETSFVRCYINGKKSGIAKYSDNSARVLYFSQSLGVGVGVADLQTAGVSLHQFNNSIVISSADTAGVMAALPGAVVELAGSAEYEARVKSAAGSRGGSSAAASSSSSATAAPTPAPSAVELPAVDASEVLNSALSSAVGGLAPMVAGAILPAVNNWAAGLVDEVRAAAVPECKESIIRVLDASGVERATIPGVAHKEFEKVLNLMNLGRNVYAWGPAGTGKSVLASQVAAALKLEFYPYNKVDDSFELKGFVDANGKYTETPFYQAVKNGGLLFLDEVDRWSEDARAVFMSVIENGWVMLPGVGRVDAHPDFKCLAAGNTCGLGATMEYSGCSQLDAAFRRRFAFVPVGYDPEIDKANAAGDDDLLVFIQDVRRACATCGVPLTASPAEIKWICKSKDILTDAENLEINLTKGLEKDQINLILGAMSVRGRWYDALKELAA